MSQRKLPDGFIRITPFDGKPSTPVRNNYLGDVIDAAQAGLAGSAADIAEGVNQAFGVGGGIAADLRGVQQEQIRQMSPQGARDLQNFGFEQGLDGSLHFKSGSNLRGFGLGVAQAVGSLAPSIVPGAAATRLLQLAARAANAGRVAHGIAAPSVGFGAVGALQIGGGAANQVRQELDAMPQETLMQSPAYRAALKRVMAENGSVKPDQAHEAAKDLMAKTLSSKAFWEAAKIGALSMGILGPVYERLLHGAVGRTRIGNAAAGAATEGGQEFFEGYGQQVAVNRAIQQADPSRSETDQALSQGLTGAVLGGVTGAGLGAITGGHAPRTEPQPSEVGPDQPSGPQPDLRSARRRLPNENRGAGTTIHQGPDLPPLLGIDVDQLPARVGGLPAPRQTTAVETANFPARRILQGELITDRPLSPVQHPPGIKVDPIEGRATEVNFGGRLPGRVALTGPGDDAPMVQRGGGLPLLPAPVRGLPAPSARRDQGQPSERPVILLPQERENDAQIRQNSDLSNDSLGVVQSAAQGIIEAQKRFSQVGVDDYAKYDFNGLSGRRYRVVWDGIDGKYAVEDLTDGGKTVSESESLQDALIQFARIDKALYERSDASIKTDTLENLHKRFRFGKSAEAHTPTGGSVLVTYAIASADDLIASHDHTGNRNPAFPRDLQPRERSRVASVEQINRIANDLKPELLGESPTVTDGAPIVAEDGVVESGNGRVAAIKLAYETSKAKQYKKWLLENAAKFGLRPESVRDTKKPVLVRVRGEPMTMAQRRQFVVDANRPTVNTLSAAEKAKADAGLLTDADLDLFHPGEDGNVLNSQNADFLRRFMERVGKSESAGLMSRDGGYTKQLADRVKAAVFAKAYRDDRLTDMMAEEANPEIQNVLNALTIVAPKFAKLRAYDNPVANDLVGAITEAANLVRKSRAGNTKLSELLSQQDVFSGQAVDPVVAEVATILDQNIRSRRRMVEYLGTMADMVQDYVQKSASDSLFGDPESGMADFVRAAKQRLMELSGENTQQGGIFESQNRQPEKDGSGKGSGAIQKGSDADRSGDRQEKDGEDQGIADFREMVQTAARWKGAAMKLDRMLKEAGVGGKERLKLSRMTTKAALDNYLMDRFDLKPDVARAVSNELTAKNIPADESADIEEFKDEPFVQYAKGLLDRKPTRDGGKDVSDKSKPEAWDDLTKAERESMLRMAGYVTKKGALNAVGKRLAEKVWRDLPESARNKLAKLARTEEKLVRESKVDGGRGTVRAQHDRADSDRANLPKYAKLNGAKKLAELIKSKLPRLIGSGKKLSWREFIQMADNVFGGTLANGDYDMRDAYDAMELGMNLYVSGLDSDQYTIERAGADALAHYDVIQSALPTQTTRTEEQVRMQQFSTPHTHAEAMAYVANIGSDDVVLEPTAGTGNLVAHAMLREPRDIYANELSVRRAALLNELIPGHVFRENANHLNALLPKHVKPTVVLMNPPFSADVNRPGKKDIGVAAKQIEQALDRLESGGRLVALVGRGMGFDAAKFRGWWRKISKQYAVRANVEVPGNLYRKQGTTFDNRLLVIDKTEPDAKSPVTGKADSIIDLVNLLKQVRNERARVEQKPGQQRASDQPAGGQKDSGMGGGTRSKVASGAATASVGGGRKTAGGGRTGKTDGGGRNVARVGNGHSAGESDASAAGDPRGGHSGVDAGGRGVSGKTPAGRSGGKVDNPAEGLDSGKGSGGIRQLKQDRKLKEDAVFDQYVPYVRFDGAKPHPAPLVESSAMASVNPPAVDYRPKIPREVIESGRLSAAQLDVVTFAGASHEIKLPDGTRRAFFIGDGTGVGKGREIAGIIMDNWNQGRKRAVWISENGKLFRDAQRDLNGVFGDGNAPPLLLHNTVKPGEEIKLKEGVLFTTYDTLKNVRGGSRLDQIVKWLGEDFDGAVIFDEAHNMRSGLERKAKIGTKKPSQKALAGIELVQRLPNGRVVYVSATGATEIENTAYLERMGLWGEGTPFPKKLDFINSIGSGGLAAMEIVAKDMKQMGVYLARSIGFDGVTYETLEHTLTPKQREIYDKAADAWQIVLRNMEEVVGGDDSAMDGRARAAARSAFWGAHQRFFEQLITALQTPAMIAHIEKELEKGHSAVIQLVSTNEAATDRAIQAAAETGLSLDEINTTPITILMDYLQEAFPTTLYETYTDEDGNERSRPVTDSNGNPVEDPRAVQKRDRLLEELGALSIPEAPIDQIINHFGPENVAEITGRSKRIIKTPEGAKLEKRSTAKTNVEADEFMEGKRRILVFSNAGGTGRSYHADLAANNQQKRIHYLLQPGWEADKAVQGFGRTHRSNQKQPPHYVLITTDLKAQKRFLSTIARRLDQLGAITKGQRDTANQGLISSEDNLESEYGRLAVQSLLEDIASGSGPVPLGEFEEQTGITLIEDGKRTAAIKETTVPRFLNRLMSMRIDTMDKVFDDFIDRYQKAVQTAKESGAYDPGLQTIKAKRITKVRDEVIHTTDTGAETRYVELEVVNDPVITPFSQAKNAKNRIGFVVNKTSGNVFAAIRLPNKVDDYGNVVERVKLVGPTRTAIVTKSELSQRYRSVAADEAELIWQRQIDNSKEVKRRVHMITGSLLPIWNRLPQDRVRVQRAFLDNGEVVLGRTIDQKHINSVLQKFGIGVDLPKLTPEEIHQKIMDEGATIKLANDTKLRKRIVKGEARIEWEGVDYHTIDLMRQNGYIVEIINYKTRLFVPLREAEKRIAEIVKQHPVVEVVSTNTRYSVGRGGSRSRATTDIKTRLLRGRFKRAARKMLAAGRLRVIRSVRELPGTGHPDGVQGAYDPKTDTVYLIADNINPDHVDAVFLHEVGVHYGLKGLLGEKKYDALMKRLAMIEKAARNGSGKVNLYFQVAYNAVPRDLPTPVRLEELAAYTVEAYLVNGPQSIPAALVRWVKELIAAIRATLIRLGFMPKEITPEDIVALARAAVSHSAWRPQTTGMNYSVAVGTDPRHSLGGRIWQAIRNATDRDNTTNRARSVLDWLKDSLHAFEPLHRLPNRRRFLADRYRVLGKIAAIEEHAKGIYNLFSKASEDDARAIYDYLTTRDADASAIQDAALRRKAEEVKREIIRVGEQLVEHGFLDPVTFEENRGKYLPRVYLKHILGEPLFKALASGKTLSDLGYLKRRKDIPEEVRRLILMEIKDPAFLAAKALTIPMRDIAISEWLHEIAGNRDWVLQQSLIPFVPYRGARPRLVTPWFLLKEAERLREQSHSAPPEDRADIRALADRMESAAHDALDRLNAETAGIIPEDYAQLPNTARYGALRGMIVRKEIYDDLVGTYKFITGDESMAEKILGDEGLLAKYTSFWKWAKVAANPPSQVRNFISNAILLQLSGVPLHRVPLRVVQAIKEMANNGRHYQVAKKYGVTRSSFAATELARIQREVAELEARNRGKWTMAGLRLLAGKIMDMTGDWYQWSESVFKTAKIIDEMSRGIGEEDAALNAHEALFDYSLVSPSVRYLRNAPIGVPFLTFYIKALPFLIKTAATKPWRFAPYVALSYMLPAIVASQYDVDDDDIEKLRKALPEWLQDRGYAYFLPWKDRDGRWQAIDLGYFFPWTMFSDVARDLGKGEFGDAMKTLGLLGGPVPDLITAIKTGIDPFTKQPIFDENDPPRKQAYDIMVYLWRMNMPTWLTDIGAAGKLHQAISGETDRYGNERATLEQALLRLAGINLYAIDPVFSRQENIIRMRRRIADVKRRMRKEMREADDYRGRVKIYRRFRERIENLRDDLRQYVQESTINPKLLN